MTIHDSSERSVKSDSDVQLAMLFQPAAVGVGIENALASTKRCTAPGDGLCLTLISEDGQVTHRIFDPPVDWAEVERAMRENSVVSR